MKVCTEEKGVSKTQSSQETQVKKKPKEKDKDGCTRRKGKVEVEVNPLHAEKAEKVLKKMWDSETHTVEYACCILGKVVDCRHITSGAFARCALVTDIKETLKESTSVSKMFKTKFWQYFSSQEEVLSVASAPEAQFQDIVSPTHACPDAPKLERTLKECSFKIGYPCKVLLTSVLVLSLFVLSFTGLASALTTGLGTVTFKLTPPILGVSRPTMFKAAQLQSRAHTYLLETQLESRGGLDPTFLGMESKNSLLRLDARSPLDCGPFQWSTHKTRTYQTFPNDSSLDQVYP